MDADDDVATDLEWKLRAAAIPAAFVLALAFHAWSTGHFFQRTFLTMIPHELGHAIAAWWCGFAAMPGLWKTQIPEARGAGVTLVVAAAEAACAYVGWRTERMWLVALGAGLGAVQFLGTTASTVKASAVISFAGDGGAMVIGTLLVLAFFAPVGSWPRRGYLRWGMLAIGAAAFVDTAATWWTARHDPDVIPYGEIEGVGSSDPSRLVDTYNWTERQLVDRYVAVMVICLVAIAAVWLWGTYQARTWGRSPSAGGASHEP